MNYKQNHATSLLDTLDAIVMVSKKTPTSHLYKTRFVHFFAVGQKTNLLVLNAALKLIHLRFPTQHLPMSPPCPSSLHLGQHQHC